MKNWYLIKFIFNGGSHLNNCYVSLFNNCHISQYLSNFAITSCHTLKYLSYFLMNFVSLCNTCHTICNKFLSYFAIINLKFVKLSLFVTLGNNFFQNGPKRVCGVALSHFAKKTLFTKDLDSIQIFGQIWSKNLKLSL